MTSFRETTTFAAFLLANIALSIAARTPISLNYHMFEEVTPGSQIGDLKNDAGLSTLYTTAELAALRFRFLMQPRINVTLDTSSGMLMTNGRLDREAMCESEITVTAIFALTDFTEANGATVIAPGSNHIGCPALDLGLGQIMLSGSFENCRLSPVDLCSYLPGHYSIAEHIPRISHVTLESSLNYEPDHSKKVG